MMGHLSADLRQKLTQAVLALYTKDALSNRKAVLPTLSAGRLI